VATLDYPKKMRNQSVNMANALADSAQQRILYPRFIKTTQTL
jgi:hypothetical protein